MLLSTKTSSPYAFSIAFEWSVGGAAARYISQILLQAERL